MAAPTFDATRFLRSVSLTIALYLSVIVIPLVTMVNPANASGTVRGGTFTSVGNCIKIPVTNGITDTRDYAAFETCVASSLGANDSWVNLGSECGACYLFVDYRRDSQGNCPHNVCTEIYRIAYSTGCPDHAQPIGNPCTCDDPYVPDPAQTSCVLQPYSIALLIPPPAEVEADATKSAYALVMNGNSPQGGVQVNLAVTPPDGGVATLVPASGTTGADGQLAFTFSAPVAGTYSLTASCSPACAKPATGVIEVKAKCPVDPLPKPPFPKEANPACTKSLEKDAGLDVDHVCPPLNPKMTEPNGGQMQCLADKINKLALTPAYTGPSATIRTVAYQKHFVDIWNKSIEIEDKVLTDADEQACAAVIADVNAEMEWHGIDAPPSKKGNQAPHVLGNALDIPKSVAKAMMEQVNTTTVVIPANCFLFCMPIQVYIGDVQDYVNSATVNPPACDLLWGGRFDDKVHFELRHP